MPGAGRIESKCHSAVKHEHATMMRLTPHGNAPDSLPSLTYRHIRACGMLRKNTLDIVRDSKYKNPASRLYISSSDVHRDDAVGPRPELGR